MTTAKREPREIFCMLQVLPYPEELLSCLSGSVLEYCTAAWRKGCLQARLASYRIGT
uniref:Uncharacterized protein n=1 Tax=Hyaloperonospora arabidopsidis (strain Emoy2) TaxID=559515 RepID=M4BJJ6_HYAAE